MASSVANFLGGGADGSALCTAQSYMISYFTLTSVAWVVVLTRVLDIVIHKPIAALGLHREEWLFHSFAWGAPFVLTLLPSTTDSYGEAGSWCWIKSDSVGTFWRMVQFYVPLWVAMIYCGVVFYRTFKTLRIALRGHAAATSPFRRSLASFPAILVLCWSLGTINRVQNLFAPSSPVFVLFLLQTAVSSLQGLLNAVAFASSPIVAHTTENKIRSWRGLPAIPHPDDDKDDGTDGVELNARGTRVGSTDEQEDGQGLVDDGELPQLEDVSFQIRATYVQNLGLYDAMGMRMDAKAFKRLADHSLLSDEERAQAEVEAHQGGKVASHKATIRQTYFTLAKSFVGIGVLAMPHAFQMAGYIGGTLMLGVVAYVSFRCMILLLDCKESIQPSKVDQPADAQGTRPRAATLDEAQVSFADLGKAAFGDVGGNVVDTCLLFSQIGFAVSYLIFIGHNVDVVATEMLGIAIGPPPVIIICGIVVLPLLWLKSLKRLAFAALLADAVICFGLLTVFAYSIAGFSAGRATAALNIATSPMAFGIQVFAFEGIGLVIPIHGAMAEPEKFAHVLRNTVLALFALLTSVGITSYVAFGDTTKDMITLNLPHNALVASVQLFYSVGLLLTSPMMLFPAFQIIERTALYHKVPDPGRDIRRKVSRTLVMAVIALTACTVPHFGLFINLIGSIACSLLAFIFPASFSLRIHRASLSQKGAIERWSYIAFGVIGGLLCFALTIQEFATLGSGEE